MLIHAPRYVRLVGKDEQTRSRQALATRVSLGFDRCMSKFNKNIPLPLRGRAAPLGSRLLVVDLLRLLPISGHLSFQSSFASMTAASFDRPRPLFSQLWVALPLLTKRTYV